MRSASFVFCFSVLLLSVSAPFLCYADDRALITELTEILTLYETGLDELQTGLGKLETAQTELTTGLQKSRTELAALRTAQEMLSRELKKSNKLIDDLEISLDDYELRVTILTWGSVGLGVVAATAVVIAIIQ